MSGRRHAIGDNDNKPFSLIDGMFGKQIDGGSNITYIILKFKKDYKFEVIFINNS